MLLSIAIFEESHSHEKKFPPLYGTQRSNSHVRTVHPLDPVTNQTT